MKNSKNLLIIIASLFIFVACATGVIIYSVNSHLDNNSEVVAIQKQLKSLMYNKKYANLKIDDPLYATDIEEQSINLITKKFDLFMYCRFLTHIPDPKYVPQNEIKMLKNMAQEKCIPTYNLIKENFSDISAFNNFINTMEYFVPSLKN